MTQTHLQNRNRITDTENRLVVAEAGREGMRESGWKFGAAEANYNIQDRQTRSYYIAHGTIFTVL